MIDTLGGREYARVCTAMERLVALKETADARILTQACQIVAEALGVDRAAIFFHEPTSDSLVVVATNAIAGAGADECYPVARILLLGHGRIDQAFSSGRSCVVSHAQHEPEALVGLPAGLDTASFSSFSVVPVTVGKVRRGILLVSSAVPGWLTHYELRFLEAVASWLGTTIQLAEMRGQLADGCVGDEGLTADDLSAITAHSVHSHLVTLQSRIHLMERRAEVDGRYRDRRDAALLSRSVKHLCQLATSMVDIERVKRGLFRLNLQPTDLSAVAWDCALLLQTDTREIQVQVPGSVIAQADAARIRQALENLLANALRYSPVGVPVVLRLTREARPDSTWVCFTVSDQGPGIPPDFLPRLFQRFSPGPDSTGLGLGLFLAREIAVAHGGTLTVNFSETRGTHFHLGFPVDGKAVGLVTA